MSNKEKNRYPQLFHIGTQKAGSTYLYNLLQQHNNIALSDLTEINFFSDDFDKGFDYYKKLFTEGGKSIDMTPKYFMLGDIVAPRIKRYAHRYLKQEPQFLLILRNPIDYLNSHYAMQKIQNPKLGKDDKNEYSLLEYIERNPGYLNRAKYFEILSNHWLKYFKLANFKIICFEEFVNDKIKIVNEILEFWRLSSMNFDQHIAVSKNKLLKYSWLHKVRKVVNKNNNLKEYLKNNWVFNFVFDKFLTKNSKNILSFENRLRIRALLKNDVASLKKITQNNFSLWEDFK